MEAVLTIMLIMTLLEFLEARWQIGESVKDIILKNKEIYDLNAFIYFLRHPTLWFAIFLAIELGVYNWLMLTLISMKFLDIIVKLNFIAKVNQQGVKYLDSLGAKDMKVSKNFKLIGMIIYPMMLVLSIIYV
jgi:hypothetical protein